MKLQFEDNDLLVLNSGSMIRGWTYETHCKFNPKEDNTIIEVLKTIYKK